MIKDVVAAAQSAGRIIQEVGDSEFDVDSKGNAGPVTRADRMADELLKTHLLDLAPIGWLSEETADDRKRLDERRLWIVDPLDGTREFVKRLPEYCVAIALVEGGEPVLGVVHNPTSGDTFWAVRGGGSFRNGSPVRVAEGRRLLASRSELNRGEFEPFEDEWDVVPTGSIQYKLALVGAGEAAATLSRGPKHEWDVCAGALIVSEAGGLVTELAGGKLTFNRPFPKVRGILAGAPDAYARAGEQLNAIGPSDRMSELEGKTE
ncbi:MAG: 3'(2'),5'-bisphosphate nucleotidase CysQ [Gemmatimonadetes bacterium]|uniref:3'(2'),5'-bisphosphate nucleotidase CysQ n=1 Tax=Candidatus Kutchimonas denitrificans TaxID=3056748 RepID=A0AAE5CC51_9BACT|nr:3'(2'),5'-bisphosphate nucleotidase CysQ [Gemmatimonadota bacterium]NIR73799.1 3'(2'),5'-bisphosphate nucleotidase CysQ [Candidatus Kutchimonas denitrificans]NIS03163.1 3'(2'),5'-bisphosphate nucleotidase CysQ [Gemmatimonadota bacterium]NIT69064.1 3'(2'),5'-bisphosphate nucleotidase CysQ [Gemmatimonadota bacterium]NIU54155.1 3'(2'),5'-bisphosphate nucleotidase CysQ [Gemmatimonadota bacterium]